MELGLLFLRYMALGSRLWTRNRKVKPTMEPSRGFVPTPPGWSVRVRIGTGLS